MHNIEYEVDYTIKLDDDNIYIRLRFNGRVFDIEFGPEDLHDPLNTTNPQPLKQQYLDALQHSFGDDEAEELDEATDFSEPEDHFDTAVSPDPSDFDCEEDPLISFAVGPFLKHGTFETFAPESSTPCLNTLQDVLHAPLLSFGLHIVDGNLIPFNRFPEQRKTTDPPRADIWGSRHWLEYPTVKAKEISLARTSETSSNTNLVMFNNRVCWFKPVLSGVANLPYIREIDILFKLSQENLSPTLRFPQLKAIVLDDRRGDSGVVNGLILSAIYPNHGTIADRINGAEGRSLSVTSCQRWCHDIENMIHILHKRDFVWGDVSPNNMIIDEDENVWIIDFGGGYTEGWVEPEDRETKKGDLQGLERIKEYLLDTDRMENDASFMSRRKELLHPASPG